MITLAPMRLLRTHQRTLASMHDASRPVLSAGARRNDCKCGAVGVPSKALRFIERNLSVSTLKLVVKTNLPECILAQAGQATLTATLTVSITIPYKGWAEKADSVNFTRQRVDLWVCCYGASSSHASVATCHGRMCCLLDDHAATRI